MPTPRNLIDEDDPALVNFLHDLQGNILKGHGRHTTLNRFLRFDGCDPAAARAALARLAQGGFITSAARQIAITKGAKNGGPRDIPVAFLMISRRGYEKLGFTLDPEKADEAFLDGMSNRGPKPATAGGRPDPGLGDPPTDTWDPGLVDPDALLIVGVDSLGTEAAAQAAADRPRTKPAADLSAAKALVDQAAAVSAGIARAHADQLCAGFAAAGISIVHDEKGRARFNRAGDGIEHFGYVDGRSQPLLLLSDAQGELGSGIDQWNPIFHPDETALAPCPAGSDCAGGYFVFRKLDQNVKAFKEAEEALEDLIQQAGGDPEHAGPMVVGRFEDGTPFIQSQTALNAVVPNNFNYDGDPDGKTCPFEAHIRKTNPRGDVFRNIPQAGPNGDRAPIMARRGIPYGERDDDPNDDDTPKPEGDVGLLFMAYMHSVKDQFEFTQKSWANNEGFVRGTPGIDPIIGQGGTIVHKWPVKPTEDPTVEFRFADHVRLRGGEYFYAPGLTFIAAMAPPAS